jgi:hypothetical protein
MTIRNTAIVLAVSIISIPALAAPVAANKYEQAALDQEIRSCIDELGRHADYSDASQVRHEIVVTKRRSLGHRLDIQTSVYSDDDAAIRAYTTRCVAYRANKPLRFTVSEADYGT